MGTRLDKIMAPILKEKCDAAFKAGYKKGFEAGGKNMSLAYQNEINSIKRTLGGKRFLLKENGELIPMDQQWIPVTERLPENRDDVLLCRKWWNEIRNPQMGWYNEVSGEWFDLSNRVLHNVTHWMYLPEPPKE